MNQKRVVALAGAFVLLCLAPLAAVGKTTRITINGEALDVPISITDPHTTALFSVWSGPGTYSTALGPGSEGFIIDWAGGPISERPSGLRRYQVSFFVNHRTRPPGVEDLAYVVFYEYDPVAQRGFVYLPGKADPEWTLNASSILRGVEGNWFRPTTAWEQLVNPLLERTAQP